MPVKHKRLTTCGRLALVRAVGPPNIVKGRPCRLHSKWGFAAVKSRHEYQVLAYSIHVCNSSSAKLHIPINAMTSESTTTYREPATIFRGTVASSFHFGSKISMILKTPALPAAEHSLRLSAVDQNTVRVYTQVFLIFPFPDINQLEAAIAALTGGLRRTLEHYPFLAGTLSLADDDSGKVVLSYPTELPDLVASGLYRSKIINDFPEYKELKQRGMPPEEFTGRRLLPDDFSRYPGVPTDGEGLVDFENGNKAPVMRIQANFTPGGLVLAVYTHHSVMDCSGINTFWTSFAENINLTRLRNAGLIADLTCELFP